MSTQILAGEKEYRPHPAVSQSELQLIHHDPQLYYDKKFGGGLQGIWSSGFAFGTLLDLALLDPDQFKARCRKRPEGLTGPNTDLEKSFCDAIMEGKEPLEAYEFAGYKLPTEKKAMGSYEKFERYFEYTHSLDDDCIEFSSQDEGRLHIALSSIAEHPQARILMPVPKLNEGLEHAMQVAIIFEIAGMRGKALIDCVTVDHKNKKIYVTDLKTTGKPISEFSKWYRIYRYDYQQYWYWLGFKRAVRDGLLPSINFGFEGAEKYEIVNCIVAVESHSRHRVQVFAPDTKVAEKALADIKRDVGLVKYHLEMDQWRHTKEEVENNFTIPISTYY